ncbi:glycosyltransferase [Pseudonocardia sp. KRD291]|uniref:glycosyltransferase n=1 Tax=Pseudonocardia sp. KRD291 TaxID=2792007 RepID=UPI001C49FD80|nr:glycosyltransferase [Pseudonocardia sp. KRD291]MBW0105268.1 glycosyltransferase [Pseudonocardia sp. KRD291]
MTLDILLPYYGDPNLMRAAVRSVRAQENPDWILTVVDDAYPDPTVKKWFEEIRDPRLRYSRNESNLGANGNYRRCLSLVTQDWFTIMGADDIMAPDYVDVIISAAAAAPHAGIVQPGVNIIDEHGNPATPLADRMKAWYAPRGSGRLVLDGELLATSLMRANWTYFPSLAWRTAALPEHGFRAGFDVVQDLALIMDVITRDWAMVLDDRSCFDYRRHLGSDSAVKAMNGTRFDEERRYFLMIAGEMDARGWSRAARTARRHISSRLNAATLLPTAIRAGRAADLRNLSRHVLTRFA